jgi:hypothetical protein
MVGVVVVMVVGVFLIVVVGLAGAMHVPLSPIVQLIPQRFVGNTGGVLEDELPTMMSGVGQESEADQRQDQRGNPLALPHPAFPPKAPHQHDSKDSESVEGQVLVLLHQLVDRVTVINDAFGLETCQHGGAGAEAADEQEDQAGPA